MTEVVRERAAHGVGVVFSSHQLDLVEDVCEDVVIIARGRIAAHGAIGDLRAASGTRHLEIELAGATGDWLAGRADLRVLERDDGRVKLLVDEATDLDELLALARTSGEIRRFSYEPPRLSELFMAAVGERDDGATAEAAGPSTTGQA
jgi:ABC-2 type transport system ATP-binding protein